MRFAIFKDKSMADLIARLFGSKGRGAQPATKHIADALLKANPQLKDVSKIPVGSLLAIPDAVPPLIPGEEAIAAGTTRLQVAQNIQSAFEALQKRLSAIDSSVIDKVKATIDRVPSAELKKGFNAAVRHNSALADQAADFATISKDAKDLVKDVQSAQPGRKQAIAQLQKSLAVFKVG